MAGPVGQPIRREAPAEIEHLAFSTQAIQNLPQNDQLRQLIPQPAYPQSAPQATQRRMDQDYESAIQRLVNAVANNDMSAFRTSLRLIAPQLDPNTTFDAVRELLRAEDRHLTHNDIINNQVSIQLAISSAQPADVGRLRQEQDRLWGHQRGLDGDNTETQRETARVVFTGIDEQGVARGWTEDQRRQAQLDAARAASHFYDPNVVYGVVGELGIGNYRFNPPVKTEDNEEASTIFQALRYSFMQQTAQIIRDLQQDQQLSVDERQEKERRLRRLMGGNAPVETPAGNGRREIALSLGDVPGRVDDHLTALTLLRTNPELVTPSLRQRQA